MTPRTLALAQMGKFFSHYGVRAMLVLFMMRQLGFSDSLALSINALFYCMIELSASYGGYLADLFLGIRKSVTMGAYILMIGYALLIIPSCFFASLGLIIIGSSLFGSNILALLGNHFSENNPKRIRGFALMYRLQNLGALAATLLCSLHPRLGFAIAALGIGVSCVLLKNQKNLGEPLEKPKKEKNSSFFKSLKPHEKNKLFIYLGALVLFFAIEDQICTSLIILTERSTDRNLLGFELPSAFIMCLNPIVILLFGKRISLLKIPFLMPFAISALAFITLSFFCFLNYPLTITYMMGIVAMISLSELMVGPTVLSAISEIGDQIHKGRLMGLSSLAYALAYLLGGLLSQLTAGLSNHFGMKGYGMAFCLIAVLALCGSLLLYRKTRNRQISNKYLI